jgi:hypothetical protein
LAWVGLAGSQEKSGRSVDSFLWFVWLISMVDSLCLRASGVKTAVRRAGEPGARVSGCLIRKVEQIKRNGSEFVTIQVKI